MRSHLSNPSSECHSMAQKPSELASYVWYKVQKILVGILSHFSNFILIDISLNSFQKNYSLFFFLIHGISLWSLPIVFVLFCILVVYMFHVTPFDSLSSWRMKALSNLSSYFPGYLAEGMSHKNCCQWPKWIRALPFLLPVNKLSKASGSWITWSRYIHFSRFSWTTTGLGVFALLQVKGLDPGSQAGWQHEWEWPLLPAVSLSLSPRSAG